MAYYDVEKIMSSLNAYDLVNYLGIPMYKSGNTTFIECPNPAHRETSKRRHCKLFSDGCNCFSCGANYNLINLAGNWLEKTAVKPSYHELLGLLGDAAGGRQLFTTSGSVKPVEKMPFSDEDLELLRISKYPKASACKTIVSAEVIENGEILKAEEKLSSQINIMYLWTTDRPAFWYIIKTKAWQSLAQYERLEQLCKDAKNEPLVQIFKQKQIKLKELMLAIGERNVTHKKVC